MKNTIIIIVVILIIILFVKRRKEYDAFDSFSDNINDNGYDEDNRQGLNRIEDVEMVIYPKHQFPYLTLSNFDDPTIKPCSDTYINVNMTNNTGSAVNQQMFGDWSILGNNSTTNGFNSLGNITGSYISRSYGNSQYIYFVGTVPISTGYSIFDINTNTLSTYTPTVVDDFNSSKTAFIGNIIIGTTATSVVKMNVGSPIQTTIALANVNTNRALYFDSNYVYVPFNNGIYVVDYNSFTLVNTIAILGYGARGNYYTNAGGDIVPTSYLGNTIILGLNGNNVYMTIIDSLGNLVSDAIIVTIPLSLSLNYSGIVSNKLYYSVFTTTNNLVYEYDLLLLTNTLTNTGSTIGSNLSYLNYFVDGTNVFQSGVGVVYSGATTINGIGAYQGNVYLGLSNSNIIQIGLGVVNATTPPTVVRNFYGTTSPYYVSTSNEVLIYSTNSLISQDVINQFQQVVISPVEICSIKYKCNTLAQLSNVISFNYQGVTGETLTFNCVPLTFFDSMTFNKVVMINDIPKGLIINSNNKLNHVINNGESVDITFYISKQAEKWSGLKGKKIQEFKNPSKKDEGLSIEFDEVQIYAEEINIEENEQD